MADETSNGWIAAVIAAITGVSSIVLAMVKIRGSKQKETPADERAKYVKDSIALEQYYEKQLEIRNRELAEARQMVENYRKEMIERDKRESDLLREANEYKIKNTVLEIEVKSKQK